MMSSAKEAGGFKYQLFAYLKMLGVPLGTRDLYA
jgi:hypothetical protein